MSDSADLDSYIIYPLIGYFIVQCTIYIRSICIDIIIYIQKAVCFGRSLYSLGRGFLIDQKEESTSTDMPLGTAILSALEMGTYPLLK
uniref:Uncharacterized protein n=1 Tax=Kalanchoe fedtschenkoi TaxID=63787 RepID=A0A7N0URZ7_KALFE